MEQLKNMEIIRKAFAYLKEDDDRTLKELLELVQIPAPSGFEQDRAVCIMDKMERIGLDNVGMDRVGNVFGTIKGTGNGPVVMIAAHTDTVFPQGTDLTIKKEGNRYTCPGINDDTRAIAEILSVARAMKALDIHGEGDIIFCANVCEEGLGDLKGVKYIFRDPHACDGFITVDNVVPGGIIHTATGSERYLVTFLGPGGHSFSDFGLPNPVHAMGRAISRIADFQVKKLPKTTFNVGVVEGGTSVNSIPERCSMLVDLRSDSAEELSALSAQFKQVTEDAVSQENARWDTKEKVTVIFEEKGRRPAGAQKPDELIVRAAWDATSAVGYTPVFHDASSTDANIPISLGIPAVALGRAGDGGDTHTVHEWFQPEEAWRAPQKELLLVLALSGFQGYRKYQLPIRHA